MNYLFLLELINILVLFYLKLIINKILARSHNPVLRYPGKVVPDGILGSNPSLAVF